MEDIDWATNTVIGKTCRLKGLELYRGCELSFTIIGVFKDKHYMIIDRVNRIFKVRKSKVVII